MIPDGERIRALRLELGLSAPDLAARLGYKRHRQTVHKLERGHRASVVLIHQVANALNVKAPEIICKDEAA